MDEQFCTGSRKQGINWIQYSRWWWNFFFSRYVTPHYINIERVSTPWGHWNENKKNKQKRWKLFSFSMKKMWFFLLRTDWRLESAQPVEFPDVSAQRVAARLGVAGVGAALVDVVVGVVDVLHGVVVALQRPRHQRWALLDILLFLPSFSGRQPVVERWEFLRLDFSLIRFFLEIIGSGFFFLIATRYDWMELDFFGSTTSMES